jgi:glyoxylase-like metal-dependent hydrolase (beta-lactamase superfamily II)
MHNTDNLIIRDVPVTSTIVQLDDHSMAIIDTGMADNPAFVEKLAEMGFQPSDFSLVINTHLHPDHIGGNRLFTNARIMISQRELEYHRYLNKLILQCNDPEALLSPASHPHVSARPVLFRHLKELAERYPVSDLIGYPESLVFLEDNHMPHKNIGFISVPGHSIDDHAVVLYGHTTKVLIAGDALIHRDLWHQQTIPHMNFSEDMFRRSAKQITGFPGIIIPGHDRAFNNADGKYVEMNEFIPL